MRANVTAQRRRRGVSIATVLAVTLTSGGADAATSGTVIPLRPAEPQAADASPYAPFVAEAAQRFRLPAAWIWAIIRAESHGDRYAVSPAGAMGLMQLMPRTWRFERARLGLGTDPFDARDNILAGSDYLAAMRRRYGLTGMLAAYNAGPGRYEDFRRHGRPLPTETIAYVRRLTPVVAGGAFANDPVIAPSDPLAWTRAPLFAARSTSSSTEHSTTADAPPIAQSSGDKTAPDAAEPALNNGSRLLVDPPASGLFVPLAGAES